MNKRQEQFLSLYLENRHMDQAAYYRSRHREFDKARSQAIILSGVLMFLASIVSLLAANDMFGEKWLWAILGVFFPALSAALTSYSSLYSFEQQSKLYQDASFALHRIEANAVDLNRAADDADKEAKLEAYVTQVEEILRSEQGQWGQLISQLKPLDVPRKPETTSPPEPVDARGAEKGPDAGS